VYIDRQRLARGGASLTILSGLVAGNFSCFWKGASIGVLMLIGYLTSCRGFRCT
jgi:K(+)-stimulated pyrophosphate-energized sodium pump